MQKKSGNTPSRPPAPSQDRLLSPPNMLRNSDNPLRNDSRVVKKNRILFDNRYVVPYNVELLIKYQAHINIEWYNRSRSIKYLFKYVNKGSDRATIILEKIMDDSNMNNDDHKPVVDEIKQFLDCRYISASEAYWRIFDFDINYYKLDVERLSFHLSDQQLSERCIGRIYYAHPASGERFYLRMLLNIIKEPTSYKYSYFIEEYKKLFTDLNTEQLVVYKTIIGAISTNSDGLFFIYGHGGTEKIYVYKTTLAAVRAEGKIALAVASSSIATLLLPDGRTAHSKFRILIVINKNSIIEAEVISESNVGDCVFIPRVVLSPAESK
ncbi:uncharacterized protein [Elaeis guineensis]|uniref:uncharacterized protein n=1 Tax=Elaeis guineensis var. tenera TaxID=51953 RepID=UPI003C6CDC12